MKTIVFAYNGNTYIGQWIYKQTQLSAQVYANLAEMYNNAAINVPSNDYIVVYAPAQVTFNITKTTETSGELRWTITPLMFGTLLNNASDTNFWMFKSSDVAISAIREDDIDKKLLSAYKELI